MNPEQAATKAIPDDILIEMVKECAGDHTLIFKKAKEHIQKNAEEIIIVRWLAENALLKQHGLRHQAKKDNAKALSEIESILDTATKLKNMLSEIPDLADTPAPTTAGLAMRMELYIYAVDNWEEHAKKQEQYGYSDADEKLRKWSHFIELLDHHISVFDEIRISIASLKKRGRPVTAKALEGFIEHIAQIYTAATGEKFTVCEYGDSHYFTEGMRFAQKSMTVLNISTSDDDKRCKEFLASTSYTVENFENACAYVAKKCKKVSRK